MPALSLNAEMQELEDALVGVRLVLAGMAHPAVASPEQAAEGVRAALAVLGVIVGRTKQLRAVVREEVDPAAYLHHGDAVPEVRTAHDDPDVRLPFWADERRHAAAPGAGPGGSRHGRRGRTRR